ncbi:MAG: hypothetical protein HFI09_02055 [Bacilli bacterium]|nr:hypothetical protein [Bacilli bacterium]
MSLDETFACYVGAYFGVREMDHYPLKEYVLHDLEIYIQEFVKNNSILGKDLQKKADDINTYTSLKTKLYDALLVLPKIQASLELILLIKERIQELKNE